MENLVDQMNLDLSEVEQFCKKKPFSVKKREVLLKLLEYKGADKKKIQEEREILSKLTIIPESIYSPPPLCPRFQNKTKKKRI